MTNIKVSADICVCMFGGFTANMESSVRAVKQAMAEWESKTCIRFVPRTNERAYLEFFRNQG